MRNLFNKGIFLVLGLFFFFFVSAQATQRPIIGITPSFSDNQIRLNFDYSKAVLENGGIPIILSPTTDMRIINSYIEMIDGAIFTGGPDIPPALYFQSEHPTTVVMEDTRFEFEQRFIAEFLNSGKPAFGICLGMQFTNVLMGGNMIQDIPDLVGEKVIHRDGQMYTNFHPVGISSTSKLSKILGTTRARVLSRHHQAVDIIGASLKPVAWSPDGVVEALERTDGVFGIFVQWHPESMWKADRNHRDKLFEAFIEACK